MKNLIIGLMLGLLIGFAGSKLVTKPESINAHNQSSSNVPKSNNAVEVSTEVPSADVKGIDTDAAPEKIKTMKALDLSSNPQTIEEYQTAYTVLQQAIIAQNKAVQKLKVENSKLTESLEEQGGRRVELQDLTASEIETAKANIEASLSEAVDDYAEVLKTALDSYNSGDVLPDTDALLRHYSDEPDFVWADVAKAYIQNYFAAQGNSNIQLAQLNCRKTYCEIYGFYSDGEQLEDPRKAGAQIQSAFQAMEQAPGFKDLFVGLESASININSENSYMSFHMFIRSKPQQ